MNNVIYTIYTIKTKSIIETNLDKTIILGIPFSDPIAEDPDVQMDSMQALHDGITVKYIFENLQNNNHQNLLLKTYANVIFTYGPERFMQQCHNSNIKGIIIPDIPYEERDEFLEIASKHNIQIVNVVSSNNINRIQEITNNDNITFVTTRPQDDISQTKQELQKYSKTYIVEKECIYIS